MSEQIANNAQTSLNASITNVATTLTVVDASLFPSSGNFRILIDHEILLVTAVSGTTFTVTRAQEGTAGIAHTSPALVTQILSAGGLIQLIKDTMQTKGTEITASSQNISTATPTAVVFSTAVEDQVGAWDGVHTTRLTAPSAGWYHVGQFITIASNINGRRNVDIKINGTTVVASASGDDTPGGGVNLSQSQILLLSANDYVEMIITQDSGSTLAVTASMWMVKMP